MDFKKPLIQLLKENNKATSIKKEKVAIWFLKYNDYKIHPNYIGVFHNLVNEYSVKLNNIYYFKWEDIERDFKIKYKGGK